MSETKMNVLIPATENTYMIRPQINRRLEQALHNPVTIIVAGAGYGKTQALYHYLNTTNDFVIWIQLSNFENNAMRLWDKFVYTISLQNKELSDALSVLGFPDSMGLYDRFVTIFTKETTKGSRYILVYDDVHLIQKKNIYDFFERFINSQIPNLSFVFVSRTEPEINSIGLYAKDGVSYINEDDLRFSKLEMRQYFELQGTSLQPTVLNEIYHYTEGWAFAIRLVDVALKRGLPHERYALEVARKNVFKLLKTDVFSLISEEVQYFLIKTSLIGDLNLELINELSLGNKDMILEMDKLSSFIRYDAFTNTYRIHHLFLKFLIEKQDLLSQQEKNATYNKAAIWYEKNGYRMDAIIFYGKTKNYSKIIEIIRTYPTILNREQTYSYPILEILRTISEDEIEHDINLRRIIIKLLVNVGEIDEALKILLDIVEHYESMPITENTADLLSFTYLYLGHIKLILCVKNGQYNFGLDYKKAYDYMLQGKVRLSRTSLESGPFLCRVGNPRIGEIEQYQTESCEAEIHAARVVDGCGYGGYALLCAEISFYHSDLKNAEIYVNQSIVKAQEKEQFCIENMAWFYLLQITMATGDYNKIMSILDVYENRIQLQNQRSSDVYYELTIGWFYLEIGQIDKVASWIVNNLERRDFGHFSIPNFNLLRCSAYYLSEKKYFELLLFLDNNSTNEVSNFIYGKIEIAILKAIAYYYTKEEGLACEWFEKAYELAFENKIERPFIELGNHMRTLVRAALQHKKCMIPKNWLESIGMRASTYAKKVAHIASEYTLAHFGDVKNTYELSKREKEVLIDLCHGLTREEIAINCGLSINTVKSMLLNVYNKLGAVNTLDAVRIATIMNLLD